MRALHALVLCLSVTLLVIGQVQAQGRPSTAALRLTYWPVSFGVTNGGGQFAGWTTGLWSLEYQLDLASLYGFRLQLISGYERGGTGSWASMQSGEDTIWNVDYSYRWGWGQTTVWAFVGYGNVTLRAIFPGVFGPQEQMLSSGGWRAGGYASVRLAANWTVNASVAWHPSNYVGSSVGGIYGSSSASSGPALDWNVSVRLSQPTGWFAEAGYRVLRIDAGALAWASCPCSITASAWFVSLGVSGP